MSSREIAELCDKRHDHVLRDIEAMLGQITEPNFGPSDFLSSYKDATGRNLKEYCLPKDLTTTLKTGCRSSMAAGLSSPDMLPHMYLNAA